jgi:hypothetical protein
MERPAECFGYLLLLMTLMAVHCTSNEIQWDHSVDLDENFRLLWRVKVPDIIIELQVRTHGYVGFGFTRSEYIYGADMVIAWVDNKHTFFKVSLISDICFSLNLKDFLRREIENSC